MKTLITERDVAYMLDVQPIPPGHSFEIVSASGHILKATATCRLPFQSLSATAAAAYVVPGLTDSLVSIAVLCDAGHTATYTAAAFVLTDSSGNTVITGRRTSGYGPHRLWTLDIEEPPGDQGTLSDSVRAYASFQYKINLQTDADLVRYVHATMGHPTPARFLAAVPLIKFPGLTAKKVRDNMPHTGATARGHIRAAPSGYHSTSHADTDTTPTTASAGPAAPSEPSKLIKTAYLKGRWAYDQTGRLFEESADGDLYMLVAHHEDADYIHVEVLKTKSDLLIGVKACHAFFTSKGLSGNWVTLDNEWSHHTLAWFQASKIDFQLTPVGQHRTNKSERHLQTFKRHFNAIMCGADKDFPIDLWNYCVYQAEITVNLLRPCPWDSTMSAWEGLHRRPWNWDAHPMGPIGAKVVVHEYPDHRASWQPSGSFAYYVGPAPHHYRCWQVVNPKTNKTRVASCLEWLVEPLKMPGSSPEEAICAALKDLESALRRSHGPGTDQRNITAISAAELLQHLREIYERGEIPAETDDAPTHVQAEANPAGYGRPPGLPHPPQQQQPAATASPAPPTAATASAQQQPAATDSPAAPTPGAQQQPAATASPAAPTPGAQQQPAATASPAPPTPGAQQQQAATATPAQTTQGAQQQPAATASPAAPTPGAQQQQAATATPAQTTPGAQQQPAATATPANLAPQQDATSSNKRTRRPNVKFADEADPPSPRAQRPKQPLHPAETAYTLPKRHAQRGGPTATDADNAPTSVARPPTRPQAPEPPTQPPAATSPSPIDYVPKVKAPRGQRGAAAGKRRTSALLMEVKASQAGLSKRERAEAQRAFAHTRVARARLANEERALAAFLTTAKDADPPVAPQRALGAKVRLASGKEMSYEQSQDPAFVPSHDERERWQEAAAKEIEDLIIKSELLQFIPPSHKPHQRSAIYYRPTLEINKDGHERVRGAAGGNVDDRIFNTRDVSSRTVDQIASKILLNEAISENAQIVTADISSFYVTKTHKLAPDALSYMRFRFSQLPQRIIDEYDLEQYRRHGSVLAEISGALYGLQDAGKISQDVLVGKLRESGYYECETHEKHCIFRSTDPNNLTAFVLHTDDFLIKYHDKPAAEGVIAILHAAGYTVKADWDAKRYCGMTITRKADSITLSMPGYIAETLSKHNLNDVPMQDTPGRTEYRKFGAHTQWAKRDSTPRLDEARLKALEQIGGAFLWIALTVRCDIHTQVSKILCDRHKSERTWRDLMHLAGYLRKHPDRGIQYFASDMVLMVHSDADFAAQQSRTGGYFYLGRRDDPSFINGPILTISTLQTIATACVAESEYIGVFTNGKHALAIRHVLTALGYPQPPTPIFCDNLCAIGIANDDIKMKRMKYVDIKYHWLRDRVRRKHFSVIKVEGKKNFADYFTKTLPLVIHKEALQNITVLTA